LNLPQVNHLDSNRANNHVSNLEWCDQFRNMSHAWDKHPEWSVARRGENAWNSILKEEDVLKIYNTVLNDSKLTKSLALEYNVNASLITAIKYGRAWNHVTHHLESGKPTSNVKSLSKIEVIEIYKLSKSGKAISQDIADRYGIKRPMVYSIKNKHCYKSVIEEYENQCKNKNNRSFIKTLEAF
jgi:hypothetical protein